MEKVDEKWLKKNGWKCQCDTTENIEENQRRKTVKHYTSYVKRKIDGGFARWDHSFTRSFLITKNGEEHLQNVSNYYIFSAFGDGFEVSNRISSRKFDSEKVEAALKVCGIE